MHKLFLLLVLSIVFVGGFTIAKNTLSKIYTDLGSQPSPVASSEDWGCDEACKQEIAAGIEKAVATLSARTVSSGSTPKPAVNSDRQVSYIPLDGSFSTTATDWVDAKGIEVAFDLSQDYPAGAKVSWEASLRVANANGTAYARLFDVTHGIAVSGSEIFVTNSADYQRISSGNLNLWAGRNIYRVQVKSLNSMNVDYISGKIRISY